MEQSSLSVRDRVRLYGNEAVELEEMIRLGFWPPDEMAAERRSEALERLRRLTRELGQLREELAAVEEQISEAESVEALIADIRRRRIERVREERERRREQKLRETEEHHRIDQERRRQTPPFLGRGVSYRLRYEGGDNERVRSLGLPKLHTAVDIAQEIGIDEAEVSWLSYHRAAATIDHYYRFEIPKRSGGMRTISSPKSRLRVAQQWVLRAILDKLPVHDAAMAFRPGRSIAHNATLHTGSAVVVRIDLKDFFPSVRFGRVRGLFHSFGYNEGVASILALLTTEAPRVELALDGRLWYVSMGDRQLPQGACTSPAITNLLCRRLDSRLAGLARQSEYTYSRYADDLVFSHDDPQSELTHFLWSVRAIVSGEGFTINQEKTRVMRPQHRQIVNGLVVNEQPHVSRQDLRRFRALLHHCETDGFAAVSSRLGRDAREYATGYVAYIRMIAPDRARQLMEAHPWLRNRTFYPRELQ